MEGDIALASLPQSDGFIKPRGEAGPGGGGEEAPVGKSAG